MGTPFASVPRRSALVHFVCDRRQPGAGPARTLTIHNGKWAYCGSIHHEAHHWVPTGGVSLFALLAASRQKRAGA